MAAAGLPAVREALSRIEILKPGHPRYALDEAGWYREAQLTSQQAAAAYARAAMDRGQGAVLADEALDGLRFPNPFYGGVVALFADALWEPKKALRSGDTAFDALDATGESGMLNGSVGLCSTC